MFATESESGGIVAFESRIQCLRALAILLVVMAHAQLPGLSAGFVGVDVFFVISGYLVVGGAQAALQRGEFTATGFLLARAWRLLPSAAMVLLCVLAGLGSIFMPAQLQDLGKHVAVSVAGLENFFLWRAGSDYFAPTMQEQPLMHLWSLAVEGQFYLCLALLAAFCRRWQWPLSRWVLPLLVLSLGVWAWGWLTHPVAAYYFLPTRGWQFMAGALVACNPVWRFRVPGWVWVSGFAAMAWLASQPVQPKALLQLGATGLAMLCLVESRGLWFQRLAERQGVRWLADHAYVLYLVHWPVWVWCQHAGWWIEVRLTPWLWLPVTLMLSALLHHWVEMPGIRAGRYWRQQPFTRRLACLSGMGFCWLMVGLAGLGLWHVKGWPERLPMPAQQALLASQDYGNLPDRCMMASVEQAEKPFSQCLIGQGEVKRIIWGDSHAATLMTGMSAWGERTLLLSTGGCPAWLDMPWQSGALCRGLNQRWLPMVLASPARDVYLVGRWPAFWSASGYGFVDGLQPFKLADLHGRTLEAAEAGPLLVAGLRKTLEALVRGGKRVTLLGPVPEQQWPVPECRARQRWNNPTLVCDEDFRKVSARLLPVERALKALAGEFPAGQVRYVSVWPVFCDAKVCRSSGPEGTYYYDDDHLSATGARYLLGRLDL